MQAQSPPPFPTISTFYNEDFAESSSSISSNLWYTLLNNKTFNTTNALAGQRWYPEEYKPNTGQNPSVAYQHAYYGYWFTPTYSSYAYITMDQGAATFGTPNSGGSQIGPPPSTVLRASKGSFEAKSLRLGEQGTMQSSSLVDYLNEMEPSGRLAALKQQAGGGGGGGGGVARIYPYIYVGPSALVPALTSPFPPTGNFYFEIAAEFSNHIGIDGSGIDVRFWADDNPVGGSAGPPVQWTLAGPVQDGNPLQNASGQYPNQDVLRIWSNSGSNSVGVNLLGYYGTNYQVSAGATSMHVYRLQGVQTGSTYTYTLLVDGVQVLTAANATVRPNCIWIGNPVYNWWTPGPDWQTLVVDYVRTGSM